MPEQRVARGADPRCLRLSYDESCDDTVSLATAWFSSRSVEQVRLGLVEAVDPPGFPDPAQ